MTTQNSIMYSSVMSMHWMMMMIMIMIMMTMMIMEAADPSETSILFNQTTKRDMPKKTATLNTK